MKRLLICFLIGILCSCNSYEPATSQIIIEEVVPHCTFCFSLPQSQSGRSIRYYEEQEASRYILSVSDGTDDQIFNGVPGGQIQCTVNHVGLYTISVKAYNNANVLIACGTTETDITQLQLEKLDLIRLTVWLNPEIKYIGIAIDVDIKWSVGGNQRDNCTTTASTTITTTSTTSTTTTTVPIILNYRSRLFTWRGNTYEQLYIETPMLFKEVGEFVDSLNYNNYGGHNDWVWSNYHQDMPGNFGKSSYYFPNTYVDSTLGFVRIQNSTTGEWVDNYRPANPIILRIMQTY